jgi:hypothetical protein
MYGFTNSLTTVTCVLPGCHADVQIFWMRCKWMVLKEFDLISVNILTVGKQFPAFVAPVPVCRTFELCQI